MPKATDLSLDRASDPPFDRAELLVSVSRLGVAFGRRRVLHDFSLKVRAGETVALVGANGSGKSTLLRALVRLELVDQGEGVVLGRSILSDDQNYNESIGYVSEMLEYQLPVKLRKIAELYADLRPLFSMAVFERVVQDFKLDISRRAAEYSRGQKTQFAFALAIASKPRLLILDEVTAVLDLHVRDLVMREVRELTAIGSSALIATNILTEVLPYADRLLIMEEGRLAMDTPLHDLDSRYAKITLPVGEAGPPGARLIKGGADGNLIYLVPREGFQRDVRGSANVNGEDVFLYHCRKGA